MNFNVYWIFRWFLRQSLYSPCSQKMDVHRLCKTMRTPTHTKNPGKTGVFCFYSLSLSTHRQDNLVILRQLPHVENGVAHAPEGCIDADAGDIGNLPEAQIPVITHLQHLPL